MTSNFVLKPALFLICLFLIVVFNFFLINLENTSKSVEKVMYLAAKAAAVPKLCVTTSTGIA